MENKIKIVLLALLLSSASLLSQTFGGGLGTYSNPYEIHTKAHWDELAYYVNNRFDVFSAKYFKLMGPIGSPIDPITQMVGTDNKDSCFAGHFDGDNHTITVDISSSNAYVGLFTQLGGYSFGIYNLIVTGQIQATNSRYAGGIVGNVYEDGILHDCHNYAEINVNSNHCMVGGIVGFTAANTYDCTSNGRIQVVGDYCYIGGIVGRLSGHNMVECHNYAEIKGNNSVVGGVIGWADINISFNAHIDVCSNYADIELDLYNSSIGGIVGISSGGANLFISDCFNIGTIMGYDNIGGIVGIGSASIEYCINNGDIIGDDCIGGILGNANSEVPFISGCINNGILIGNGSVGGMVGCY